MQIPKKETLPFTHVVQLLQKHNKDRSTSKAMIVRQSSSSTIEYTWQEFYTAIERVSLQLRSQGLQSGDRIYVFIKEPHEFLTTVFACLHAGVVPVLIDPGMGYKNARQCVMEQQGKALIAIRPLHILSTLDRAPFRHVRVRLAPPSSTWMMAQTLVCDVLANQVSTQSDKSFVSQRTHEEDVAVIVYTSGSTGVPKGVPYTHKMLWAQTQAIQQHFAIQPGDIEVCCFLPFALFSLAMGSTCVFPAIPFAKPAAADVREIQKTLHTYQASALFASPAILEPFATALFSSTSPSDSWIFPSLKRILTAGAPISPALLNKLITCIPNGDIHTPYGATEALPVAFMNARSILHETASMTQEGKGTCVGRIAPQMRVRIVDPRQFQESTQNKPLFLPPSLPVNYVGEILVSGDVVTTMYDGRPEITKKTKILHQGELWHRMGDVGSLDEQGRLWMHGRLSHRVWLDHTHFLDTGPVEAIAEEALLEWAQLSKRHTIVWNKLGKVALANMNGPVIVLEIKIGKVFKSELDSMIAMMQRRLKEWNPRCIISQWAWIQYLPRDRRHNAKIEREKLTAKTVRFIAVP